MDQNFGQTLWQGPASWTHLEKELDRLSIKSVLLITGGSSYKTSGLEQKLSESIESRAVIRVFDFETNPKGDDIRRILEGLSDNPPPEAIIAAGGGSVIDVAKLLKSYWKIGASMTGSITAKETFDPLPCPVFAIPSTAGSGSEATHFAVVYEGSQKFSIAHADLLPNYVILDSELLHNLPRPIAAAAAMDALCQGIESYWSIHADQTSQALAKRAIQLSWSSMVGAVLKNDPDAWEELMTAAHLAGQAINLTKTTAPHAVSYALSSGYDIQHGHAVGLMVSMFFDYNFEVTEEDCLEKRGRKWVRNTLQEIASLLNLDDVSKAGPALKNRMRLLGLECNLAALGIKDQIDLEWIVDNGFNPQRVNNNPRKLSQENLRRMLQELSLCTNPESY